MCENSLCKQKSRKLCLSCIEVHKKDENFTLDDIKNEGKLLELITDFKFYNKDKLENILL